MFTVCSSDAIAATNSKTVKTEAQFTPQVKRAGHTYVQKIDSKSRTFYIDDVAYFCYNGVYYQHVKGKGYQEILMPENVVVQDLPYGARRTYVNGYSYYNADGMWFQPTKVGFLIVSQPRTSNAAYAPIPGKVFQATFGY